MNTLETMKTMSDRQFQHAMLREIYEQPDALARTIEQYVAFTPTGGRIQMKALTNAAECFRKHKDLVIAASGSSRHAGLAAEIMLEDAAGLSVDVEYASEYITRSTNTKRDPAVLVISQSGETADTLAALREAKQRKHPTLAVTNVENSSMASEADLYLRGARNSCDEELHGAIARVASAEPGGCRRARHHRRKGDGASACGALGDSADDRTATRWMA
jgi:glucosamine--fructose-6-phosphate aminotransferase (isomerizing)